ncbi:hypothetical protein ACFQ07_27985 [Actinomadura adrarensis]|uniref:DUF559 domain-containing protein n=1 Tax=Actinomadura adrarensis TaxID=1819600 RepID=A0ABW3CRG4_9ACTN
MPAPGPFLGTDALRMGVTKDDLAGPRFRRILHNVYVLASVPDGHELRCRAATLVMPDEAVFCGITAARLYGIATPARDQRIHMAVPAETPTLPRIASIKAHLYTIPPEQIGAYHGWRIIRPERLFLELAATVPRVDLIIAGDQLLRRSLTSHDELDRFLHSPDCHRKRGVQRGRDALEFLDERADSPPETRLRMLLIDSGLPRPVVNQDVYNSWGVWLARPDLSYPDLKIAIQYEGAHHQQDPRQYASDIERDGRLTDLGWLVIRVDKRLLFDHPELVVARVRKARRQRPHC